MNRRRLLYYGGLGGAALIGGGAFFIARRPARSPQVCMGLSYSDLPENVGALYHEDFVGAFPDTTLEEMVTELDDLGVCTRSGFSIERVRSNAADDPLMEFDGMFWTKSELLMYAAVARIHRMSQSPGKDEQ